MPRSNFAKIELCQDQIVDGRVNITESFALFAKMITVCARPDFITVLTARSSSAPQTAHTTVSAIHLLVSANATQVLLGTTALVHGASLQTASVGVPAWF